MRGLPWALRNRRVVPPQVEALCELVERHPEEPRDLAATSTKIGRPADRPFRARSSMRSPNAKHGGV